MSTNISKPPLQGGSGGEAEEESFIQSKWKPGLKHVGFLIQGIVRVGHGLLVVAYCSTQNAINSNPPTMLFLRRNRVSGVILNSIDSSSWSFFRLNDKNSDIDMSIAMTYSLPSINAIPFSFLFGSLMILPCKRFPHWSCIVNFSIFWILANFSSFGSLGINGETCIYNGFPFSREWHKHNHCHSSESWNPSYARFIPPLFTKEP